MLLDCLVWRKIMLHDSVIFEIHKTKMCYKNVFNQYEQLSLVRITWLAVHAYTIPVNIKFKQLLHIRLHFNGYIT